MCWALGRPGCSSRRKEPWELLWLQMRILTFHLSFFAFCPPPLGAWVFLAPLGANSQSQSCPDPLSGGLAWLVPAEDDPSPEDDPLPAGAGRAHFPAVQRLGRVGVVPRPIVWC